MLKVVTLLWDANAKSKSFSRCYDEKWVRRLRDGFKRHLTAPHQFVLFTDRHRNIGGDVLQVLIDAKEPDYGACIEPYRLNDPMILVGLDTIITGNIDQLAHYCLRANIIALPKDPYFTNTVCNGVALVPGGMRHVYDEWHGENDMEWMRGQRYKLLDSLFPGQVESYKGAVHGRGLRDTRICYFHGNAKPHEIINDVPWVREHWLADEEWQ